MNRRNLIIFAREPVPGLVKTRLAPTLGPGGAAELYAAMLRDTVAKAALLPGIETALSVCGDPAWFRREFPGIELFRQEGDDLGARMAAAFAGAFRRGYRTVCIIGSDSPDLPPDFVTEAFRKLENGADAVFGPSRDGGYYLVGLGRPSPELFTGMAWSTENVLRESLRRGEEAGLRAALLPEWHDVDEGPDLEAPGLAAGENGAVLTGEFLRRRHPSNPGS